MVAAILDETAAFPGGIPERPAIAGPGAGPLPFIELIDAPVVAETVATGTVAVAGCAVGAVGAVDVAATVGAAAIAAVGASGADVGALDAAAAGFAEGAVVELEDVPWSAPCAEGAVEDIFFAGADGFLLSSSISRFLLRARSLRESGLSTSSPSFLYLLREKLTESLNSLDAGV